MTYIVKGIPQVLALIPHEFGFRPQASVVFVMVRGTDFVGLARMDDLSEAQRGSDREIDVSAEIAEMERVFVHQGVEAVFVVAFDSAMSDAQLEALSEGFRRVRISHLLQVGGQLWKAIRCHEVECDCVKDAWNSVADSAAVPYLSEVSLPVRGRPRHNRQEWVEELYSYDEFCRQKVEQCLASFAQPNHQHEHVTSLTAWATWASNTVPVTAEQTAHLLEAFSCERCRNAILCCCVPEIAALVEANQLNQGLDVLLGPAPGDQLLIETLVWMPESHRAMWLALIALLRWRRGATGGAWEAIKAAEQEPEPDSLVALVKMLVASGKTYREMSTLLASAPRGRDVRMPDSA